MFNKIYKKMRIALTATALMLSMVLSAQEFSGKAIYKTHRKSNIKIGSDGPNGMTPEMQKQLEDRMKKMFQKTFVLNFNRTESTYKEDVNLSSPAPQPGVGGGVTVMTFGGGGGNDLLYKNIKEGRYANKRDLMGKTFLVKDSLLKYDWKMTGETKNIGNYTCYKAVYEREEESISMSMVDGEMTESKKMEKVTTIAWYTLDVPVSHGPGNYGGLPGLILEVNDGNQTIVCTEIVLNPTEKVKIVEPAKGKKVNRAKFQKISRDKSKEMMERFRTKRGSGNGMELRIGG